MSVVLVKHGVTASPRDQPPVEREREDKGDYETQPQAPPEDRPPESCLNRARHHQDECVIDDLHDCDRSGVRGKGQRKRATQRYARTEHRAERQRIPEEEGRTIEIAMDAVFPHPKAVATTMPRTSPIAQPVRQWVVALRAARFSDACA